ncbi:uncharacterized protein LOC110866666 [Helianthus annuus]|uniref:uncharacterized protein LOC110866666 n=1 Tax=Helianthus annuus TaxID=4232 RepID=UPI000B8F9EAB|nr:uncharacterized protein LOC110866666 [Helianthus annuus]
MKAKGIPNFMWGEAVRHASYILNRSHTRALQDQTPYEMFNGRKPNLKYLKIFGCIAYAKVMVNHLEKLADRSKPLVYLGNEPGSKAFRLYDPKNRKIVVNRDVEFDEKRRWNWSKTTKSAQYGAGTFILTEYVDTGVEQVQLEAESGFENVVESGSNDAAERLQQKMTTAKMRLLVTKHPSKASNLKFAALIQVTVVNNQLQEDPVECQLLLFGSMIM